MAVQHHVDRDGRYDGWTLQELWPLVVDEVVADADPIEVILFGSVARGDDGPDSDIDLLVVLDHIDAAQQAPDDGSYPGRNPHLCARGHLRHRPRGHRALYRNDVGSLLYWPVREGRSVYHRPRARAR